MSAHTPLVFCTTFKLTHFPSEEKQLRSRMKELMQYRRNGITRLDGKEMHDITEVHVFEKGSENERNAYTHYCRAHLVTTLYVHIHLTSVSAPPNAPRLH